MHLFTRPKQLEALSVFIQFAVRFLPERGTLIEAATEACDPHRLEEAQQFFMKYGFDGAEVTTNFLEHAAVMAGWHKRTLRPQRTFADMIECLKQHSQGLVTDGEALLAVQLSPHQVHAVIDYNRLPMKVQSKFTLAAWDDDIAMAAEKGVPPFGR